MESKKCDNTNTENLVNNHKKFKHISVLHLSISTSTATDEIILSYYLSPLMGILVVPINCLSVNTTKLLPVPILLGTKKHNEMKEIW